MNSYIVENIIYKIKCNINNNIQADQLLTNWEKAILSFKNSLNVSNDFSSRNRRGGQFSGFTITASPGNILLMMRRWLCQAYLIHLEANLYQD